jgi:multicomponent Na+:H+ antiporter subunit D
LFTMVGAFGLCGVPPFATFSGKSWVEESAARHTFHWVPLVLSLTAALTAGTVLRMAGRVFFGLGPSEEGTESGSPSGQEIFPTAQWSLTYSF